MVPVTQLRSVLRDSLEQDPAPSPDPGDRLAAVVVPFVEGPDPSLVFTVRAIDLSRHAGEISFPGGLQDPGETLQQTAVREASRTLRNIRSIYVKEMSAAVENGRITSYRLNSKVSLELEGARGGKK